MIPLAASEDLHPAERRRLARLARREVRHQLSPSPHIGSRKPYMVELPRDGIDEFVTEEQRRACAAMVDLASKDLGLSCPDVIWLLEIAPTDAGQLIERGMQERLRLFRRDYPVGGLALSTRLRIWVTVSPSLSTERIAFVTAHEVRHIWQGVEGLKMTHEEGEADANAYARDAARRLPWRERAESMHPRLPSLIA